MTMISELRKGTTKPVAGLRRGRPTRAPKMKPGRLFEGLDANRACSESSPQLSRDEAKACEAQIRKCFANMTEKGDTAGKLLYEFLAGNGPKVLGVDEAEMRKRLGKKMGVHRSTVYRIYDWVLTEIALGLAHRDINEFTARTLKTKVRADAWGRVVKKARTKKGSYREITSSTVLETAEELGCLKGAPAGQIDTDQGKRPRLVSKHPNAPRKTKSGVAVGNDEGRGRGDRPDTSAADRVETSTVDDADERIQANLDKFTPIVVKELKLAMQRAVPKLVPYVREIQRELQALSPDDRAKVVSRAKATR